MPLPALPIGISDFKSLRQKGLYYFDKSLLVEELMADGASVVLLPRPRRFGKTLNLSMLRYFFDCTQSCAELFGGLAITQSTAWGHQGQYPVIYFSFKELTKKTFTSNFELFKEQFQIMAEAHAYLLESDRLSVRDKDRLTLLLSREVPDALLHQGFTLLSRYLYQHHQKQVMLLIDEYDTPLIYAHTGGYYADMIDLMRSLLSSALKDNDYLAKGVVTGILRIAKESIFSGLNNMYTGTLLQKAYSQWFGLSQQEVKQALSVFDMQGHYTDIETWYNGYLFGGQPKYNPWSIISYLRHPEEGLRTHWVNTSNNELIGGLLGKAGNTTIKTVEALLQGQTVETTMREHTVFAELDRAEEETLFSFLVFSGYLKAQFSRQEMATRYYAVSIPNVEVQSLYTELLRVYLRVTDAGAVAEALLNNLLAGRAEELQTKLQQYVLSAFSHFDVAEPEAERVYHGFMLGVLAYLHTTHHVLSNRETGLGRADMLLVPRAEDDQRAYVLEFKQAPHPDKLAATAHNALQQITQKHYQAYIQDRGKTQICHYAIAFYGKLVVVYS